VKFQCRKERKGQRGEVDEKERQIPVKCEREN